jgi:hypothetical protein
MASKDIDARRAEMLAAKTDTGLRKRQAEVDAPTLAQVQSGIEAMQAGLEAVKAAAAQLVVDRTSDHIALMPFLKNLEIMTGNVGNIVGTLTADADAALAGEA